MPHLFVSVRFTSDFEKGSGTKSTGRRPKSRAPLQVSPTVCGTQMCIDVLFHWWEIDDLGFFGSLLNPP